MEENSMTTTHDREARVSRHFTLPPFAFILSSNHAGQLFFHPLMWLWGLWDATCTARRTTEICCLEECNTRRKGRGVWRVWMSITCKMGKQIIVFQSLIIGGKGESRSSVTLVSDSERGKGKLWGSCLSIATHSGEKVTCQGRHC